MANIIDHIAGEFKLSELVIIAEELKLSPTSRWGARQLVDAIITHIEKKGIPASPGTYPQQRQVLLEEFLYTAGYIDKDGKPMPEVDISPELKGMVTSTNRPTLLEFMAMKNIPNKPECYSYADDQDPACRRCLIYPYCAEARIASLPPCFGLRWDPDIEACNVCLEAPFCKDAVLSAASSSNDSLPIELIN